LAIVDDNTRERLANDVVRRGQRETCFLGNRGYLRLPDRPAFFYRNRHGRWVCSNLWKGKEVEAHVFQSINTGLYLCRNRLRSTRVGTVSGRRRLLCRARLDGLL
jgi:hypothetical protein